MGGRGWDGMGWDGVVDGMVDKMGWMVGCDGMDGGM